MITPISILALVVGIVVLWYFKPTIRSSAEYAREFTATHTSNAHLDLNEKKEQVQLRFQDQIRRGYRPMSGETLNAMITGKIPHNFNVQP